MHRLDNGLLYNVADRNITFSITHSTCFLLIFGIFFSPVQLLPIDRKCQKGQYMDNYIIVLFNSKYKRQWINVIFLQDEHTINAVS
jgi:hypothetical protein